MMVTVLGEQEYIFRLFVSQTNYCSTMFICQSGRLVKPNYFVNALPPILLLNIGKVKFDVEKNEFVSPSVKDLPFLLFIDKQW